MSLLETPQQRQIRDLKARIRYMSNQQLGSKRRNEELDRMILQAKEELRIMEEKGRGISSVERERDPLCETADLKEKWTGTEPSWNSRFRIYKEWEIRMLETISACENRVYEFDYEGGTITDRHGMDYWTNGRLSLVRNRIYEFRQRIGEVTRLGIEGLREAAEEAGELLEEIGRVENMAHTNVAMSLSRGEMARKIGKILGDHYQMIDADGDYFSEENKEEYHAIFKNPITGDQAALVVTPVMGEDGVVSNHIELIVGNTDNNPITRDQISQTVAETLRQEGIQGAAFPCSGKYGDKTGEECRRVGNMEAVAAGDEKARGAGV